MTVILDQTQLGRGLRLERRGAAAWLILDRPDDANAFDAALLDALEAALTALAVDPCRAVVVTGAGDRVFSAGADLKERLGMDDYAVRSRLEYSAQVLGALAHLPQLTVAAINGLALGGGLELALACDLRVAVEHADVGQPEVRLGIIPGAGATARLPRLVGPARAKEMILLGRRLGARRAYEVGLVDQVVPRGQLAAAVAAIVEELEGCGPVAVAAAKRAVDDGLALPLELALVHERRCYEDVIASEDRLEGLAAFREKRRPRFVGR